MKTQWCKVIAFGTVLASQASTAEPVITLTTEERPPFSYMNKNAEIVGLSTAVVRQLFTSAKIEYKLDIYPWARAYHMAKSQENTAIYTILKTPEREPLFQWVCPIQPAAKHAMYRLKERKDIQITELKDAKKYRVGIVRQDFSQNLLNENGFIAHIHYDVAANDKANFKKLFAHRIDLVLVSDYVIEGYLIENNLPTDSIAETYYLKTTQEYSRCLAFSLTTPTTIVDKLRKALRETEDR